MLLTWVGIVATVIALVAWFLYENRQLIRHSARFSSRAPAGGPPPQPGGVGDSQ
jgi:hypothetical protein